MKKSEIGSETGKAYFAYWSMALKSLLGWPNQRVEQWAEKFKNYLSNENDMLFHNPPAKYIIGEYLHERHPGWMEKLREKKGLEYYPIMYDLTLCIDDDAHP